MAKGQDRGKNCNANKGDALACVKLWEQTLTGDMDAYKSLVAETKGHVRSWFRFYGSDIPEADLPDLADEVYFRFFRYMLSRSFLPVHDGQIFKCLKTITSRVVYDYIKKRNCREEAEAGFVALQQADDAYSEVENIIDRENLACDRVHCQMIGLRKNGRTYQEIADKLGLKLHQVTAFFYKLRKKFKKS